MICQNKVKLLSLCILSLNRFLADRFLFFQLSDAIGYIGYEDFPEKWPNLIPELVEKFQSGDFHVINGVLHTSHSLFKR